MKNIKFIALFALSLNIFGKPIHDNGAFHIAHVAATPFVLPVLSDTITSLIERELWEQNVRRISATIVTISAIAVTYYLYASNQ